MYSQNRSGTDIADDLKLEEKPEMLRKLHPKYHETPNKKSKPSTERKKPELEIPKGDATIMDILNDKKIHFELVLFFLSKFEKIVIEINNIVNLRVHSKSVIHYFREYDKSPFNINLFLLFSKLSHKFSLL